MRLRRDRFLLISLIMVVMILFGLVARFFALSQIPWGGYWDEIAMLVDIKAVLATGKDMHGLPWYQLIYPSYGDYKAPVYLLVALLPSKLFGTSLFSLRLVAAIVGSLTVLVTGLISWQLTKLAYPRLAQRTYYWIGLSSLLAAALSPWGFMFSRVAFEAFLAQFFLTLAVWFLLLFNPAKKAYWWHLGLALLAGELSIYTYYSNRYVWPVVLVVTLIVKFFSERNLKPKAQNLKIKNGRNLLLKIFSLVSLSLLATYLLVLPLRHSPYYGASQQFRLSTDSVISHQLDQVLRSNLYRQLAGNTWLDRLAFHRFLFLFNDLAKNLSANLSLNNLFLTGDPNLRHGTGMFGLFLISFLPFFIIGLYQLAKNNRPALVILVSWWLVALLPASVPNEVPHALRSLNALVPLSIIIGYGIGYSFFWLEKRSQIRVVGLMLVMVWVANFAMFLNYYFQHYPLASASSWQVGYPQSAKLIYRLKQPKEPVVILNFDDRFYLWLMAYGPFGGSEFANWPERDFKKIDFDNVFFSQPKEKLDQLIKRRQRFMLAGDATEVLATIKQYQLKQTLCFPAEVNAQSQVRPLVCKVIF